MRRWFVAKNYLLSPYKGEPTRSDGGGLEEVERVFCKFSNIKTLWRKLVTTKIDLVSNKEEKI